MKNPRNPRDSAIRVEHSGHSPEEANSHQPRRRVAVQMPKVGPAAKRQGQRSTSSAESAKQDEALKKAANNDLRNRGI